MAKNSPLPPDERCPTDGIVPPGELSPVLTPGPHHPVDCDYLVGVRLPAASDASRLTVGLTVHFGIDGGKVHAFYKDADLGEVSVESGSADILVGAKAYICEIDGGFLEIAVTGCDGT